MNRVVNVLEALADVMDGIDHLVVDDDRTERFDGRWFIHCRDACHEIPDVADLLHGHRMLVLGDR